MVRWPGGRDFTPNGIQMKTSSPKNWELGTHWEILHRKGHESIYNLNPNLGCAAGNDCGKGKNGSRVIVTPL